MKISIVADDKMVVKDGVGMSGLTLSGLAADIWAVQWDSTTSKGHVEKRDNSVTEITSFGDYAAHVTEYDTALAAELKKIEDAKPTDEEKLRTDRNNLLFQSDWTIGNDSPLSTSKQNEWKTYRQALRDLPANTSDPAKPTFPTKPS